MYRYQREQLGDQALRLPAARLPQAAPELHLVGEPQGPHGAQRLRGRIPRARQHRRVRSQRAAAHRRMPRAGRRHRLDGALRPEHARDRARAGAARPRPTRRWRSGSTRTSVGIAAAMDHIGERQDEMWDEDAGFFYDVLRLPDGTGHAARHSLDGGAASALRGHGLSRGGAVEAAALRRRVRAFNQARPDLLGTISQPERKGVAGRRMLAVVDETKLRRVLARLLDPAEFLSDYGIRALSRHHLESSVRLPRRRGGAQRRLPPRRVRLRHVRRQLELARAHLDAGERAADPGAAPAVRVLRRRLPRRVSHRVRAHDDAVRGEPGDRATARRDLPPGRERTPRPCTAA